MSGAHSMRRYRWTGVAGCFLALAAAGSGPAAAQEADSVAIRELQAQVEAITRQLEELRLGQDVVAEADTGQFGFAPGASKVYRVRQGVSIGGYGEFLYEGYAGERQDGAPSDARDRLDALRAILYVGYKFNDRILFNSEIEVEHGSTDEGGSVSVEFAYVDYRLSDAVGVRAGMLLSPMGIVNEQHEPPTFLGTERPETEQRIIPSTWRENGVGVFGGIGPVAFRAYLLNGFDGVGGFSGAGLRGGRQKGANALAERFAGVARVDYQGAGVTAGTSAYYGESGQNASVTGDPTTSIDAATFIWEGHAAYQARGLELRGLFAVATVGDADLINAERGFTGNASVGERLLGWYVQAGYDALRGTRSDHQLIPYVRYERVNTQDRVPAGFAANPANDQTIVSLGLAWKPILNVVVKTDYQVRRNGAETGVDQLNVALGYLF